MGIEMLEESESLNITEMESVRMMNEASRFMSETLNAVLTMQKIEQGKLELQMKPFQIADKVKAIVSTFEGMAKANHIATEVDVQIRPSLIVLGDSFQLDHVTANFLSNAIKFSKPYSKITVVVEGKPIAPSARSPNTNKHEISVSVRDEGPGISKEDIAKLFTPFMQIRPGELQQGRGTGIGLSICKQIVKLHGGEITCESEVGVGSVFKYTIPFEEVVSPGTLRLSEKSSRRESGGSVRIKRRRETLLDSLIRTQPVYNQALRQRSIVLEEKGNEEDEEGEDGAGEGSEVDNDYSGIGDVLVVDDVASNRKMLSLLLSRRKVRSEMAEDGADVVDMARVGSLTKFKLVLMDNQMPRMTGVQAVKRLREIGFKHLVIGLTASALSDDVEAYVDAGADFVLSKPLHMEKLDEVLRFIRKEGCESLVGHRLVNTLGGDLEW
eukprot:gene5626-7180_t